MAIDAALVRRFASAMEVSERHARAMIRETAGVDGAEALVRRVTERIEAVEARHRGSRRRSLSAL